MGILQHLQTLDGNLPAIQQTFIRNPVFKTYTPYTIKPASSTSSVVPIH
jgi:hypothetical protein